MEPSSSAPTSEMAQVVDRNIRALIARRNAEEQRRSPQEQLADSITGFTGSMTFVYLHLLLFGLWLEHHGEQG